MVHQEHMRREVCIVTYLHINPYQNISQFPSMMAGLPKIMLHSTSQMQISDISYLGPYTRIMKRNFPWKPSSLLVTWYQNTHQKTRLIWHLTCCLSLCYQYLVDLSSLLDQCSHRKTLAISWNVNLSLFGLHPEQTSEYLKSCWDADVIFVVTLLLLTHCQRQVIPPITIFKL